MPGWLFTLVAFAGEPFELRVASEVYQQGDDRTATAMEAWVLDHASLVGPCRDLGIDAGEEPIRYVALRVWLKTDGSVRKTRLLATSESATTDACVLAATQNAVLVPPPMFADQLRVNVTWAKPAPLDAPPK